MVVFFRRLDADLRGGETAFADFRDLQRDRQAERIDRLADRVGVHAGVDKGAERHVAADAAEAVEVGYAHRWRPLFQGVCDAVWRRPSQGAKPLQKAM